MTIAAALAALAGLPSPARAEDPFQSAPVVAPPKPQPPRPAPQRPSPRRPAPEAAPPPAAVVAPAPVPAVTAPASYRGTWAGQVYQFPLTLVVEADNGQTMRVVWQGSRVVAGRVVAEAPVTLTGERHADGSFSVVNPGSDNAIENGRWCGADLCATFYLRSADSRVAVVFRRTR